MATNLPVSARPALELYVLPGIPLIESGDDLGALIVDAMDGLDIRPESGDIVAVAQKIVSKAEGRLVNLDDVAASPRAVELAHECDKDPRTVQLILNESARIVRTSPGVIITEHRLGLVLANAGIDRSNVAGNDNQVLLLPEDPDASAARLRDVLCDACRVALGVLITDSVGRPWRLGTTGIAIGSAGLTVLDDRRGTADLFGRPMQVAEVAIADSLAAVAALLMGEGDEASPVVLIRGADHAADSQRAVDVLRPADEDLFR